jgi:cytoskeletal protein RodZ
MKKWVIIIAIVAVVGLAAYFMMKKKPVAADTSTKESDSGIVQIDGTVSPVNNAVDNAGGTKVPVTPTKNTSGLQSTPYLATGVVDWSKVAASDSMSNIATTPLVVSGTDPAIVPVNPNSPLAITSQATGAKSAAAVTTSGSTLAVTAKATTTQVATVPKNFTLDFTGW